MGVVQRVGLSYLCLYRYVPKDSPRAQEFGVAGVSVSLDRSDDKTVEIPRISLDTAGTYMCEVSSIMLGPVILL